jgi:hypothetical protein
MIQPGINSQRPSTRHRFANRDAHLLCVARDSSVAQVAEVTVHDNATFSIDRNALYTATGRRSSSLPLKLSG